jgi:radical SAM superfamily enzyme YgiQ (UPF0313 family)
MTAGGGSAGIRGRVILVNPRATYAHEIAQKCYPPMQLLYLAAALRAQGAPVSVIDANAFRMTDAEVVDAVAEGEPLLVGVSLYSEILPHVRDLTKRIRARCPAVRLVLGGAHATAVPAKTLEQFPEVDFVLAGEGEASLPELYRQLSVSGGADAGVPGLYQRSQGRTAGSAGILPDIEQVPLPARDLVERAYREKRYYTILVRHRPVDTLFTSRGCPFRCAFCYNFRHTYRARSPESVVEEILSIRARGIRDVEICDDTFSVNEDRALRILDLLAREKTGLAFRIKSRSDVFSEEMAKAARAAGVYQVSFGMESGSQRILDAMDKRLNLADHRRVCDLSRRYGLMSHSSWIVGYPGETRETMEQTLRFIRTCRPTTVNLGVLRPYPNTAVHEQARSDGTLQGDWSPEMTEFPWVRLPWTRTRDDLEQACRALMRAVYLRPGPVVSLAWQVARNMNGLLARYAWQELRKVVGGSSPLRVRS